MRDIKDFKFRARTPRGTWVCGLLCHDEHKDKDFYWFISNSIGKPYAFGIEPSTISRYTGVRDVNGDEIYGGYILMSDGIKQNSYCEVHWVKAKLTWYIGYGPMVSYIIDDGCLVEWKIVGNVHDNSDLLK